MEGIIEGGWRRVAVVTSGKYTQTLPWRSPFKLPADSIFPLLQHRRNPLVREINYLFCHPERVVPVNGLIEDLDEALSRPENLPTTEGELCRLKIVAALHDRLRLTQFH